MNSEQKHLIESSIYHSNVMNNSKSAIPTVVEQSGRGDQPSAQRGLVSELRGGSQRLRLGRRSARASAVTARERLAIKEERRPG